MARDARLESGATGHRFRSDIEGLRAIAVVAVVLYHARIPRITGGYVGVDVFFVISGFLITGLLLRDAHMRPLALIRHFYARRIRRIMPAATLVIVATLLGAAVLQTPLLQQTARDDAVSAMFFFSNLRFAHLLTDYFHQGSAPSLFQHFWSLSVEEQFYLLWPALIVVASLVAPRRQRVAIGVMLAVTGLASFALSVRLTSTDPTSAFYLLPTRAWELCVGAALALGAERIRFGTRTTTLLRVGGLAAIAIAILRLDDQSAFPGLAALLPVLGCAAVIAAGTPAEASPGRLLSALPMQLGGRYSYSLYLWHWPALRLAGLSRPSVLTNWHEAIAVSVLLALPAAVVSYHALEHPVRVSFGRRPDRSSLLAGGALATAFAVALVPYSALAVGNLDAGRRAQSYALPVPEHATDFVPSNLRPSLDKAFHYDNSRVTAACRAEAHCVIGAANATPTVVLFGDSHADHWVLAFAEMGRRNGWRIEIISQPGCRSFVEPRHKTDIADCNAFRAAGSRRIRASRPDVVVFSNQAAALFTSNPDLWARGVGEAIDGLPSGVRAVVMSQTPGQGVDRNVPLCLAEHLSATRACEPKPATFLRLNAALQEVTTQHGATFLDLTPWFCTPTRCPAVMGNMLVYRDANHLTEELTLARVGAMGDLLRPLLAPAS